MLPSARNLWTFACKLYSNPEVASACLELQDRYAIDVPLLIFCCWSGRCYGELSPPQLQQALSFSKGWSVNTTKALRSIRRDMKTSYSPQWPVSEIEWSALREQVKSLELKSERLMLEGLSRSVESLPIIAGEVDSTAAITHIKYCFRVDIDDVLSDFLICLLSEVFQDSEDDMRMLISTK